MRSPLSTEVERLRRARAQWELDLDLQDLLRDREFAEYMLAHMPKIEFNQQSPFRGDDRFFGVVDLRVAEYPMDRVEKYRLMLAVAKTGVVGEMEHGWIYVRDGSPLRAATEEEVWTLPHLPDAWERHMVNDTSEMAALRSLDDRPELAVVLASHLLQSNG